MYICDAIPPHTQTFLFDKLTLFDQSGGDSVQHNQVHLQPKKKVLLVNAINSFEWFVHVQNEF